MTRRLRPGSGRITSSGAVVFEAPSDVTAVDGAIPTLRFVSSWQGWVARRQVHLFRADTDAFVVNVGGADSANVQSYLSDSIQVEGSIATVMAATDIFYYKMWDIVARTYVAQSADFTATVPSVAISFVGADHANSVFGASSLTVTIPSVVDGDLGILVIDLIGSSDPGNPTTGLSGWGSPVVTIAGGADVARHLVYVKSLVAGDSGVNVTPGYGTSKDWSVSLLVLRGADTVAPIGAVSSRTSSGSGTSCTFPTFTTTAAGSWVVSDVIARQPQTNFTLSGPTERTDSSGTNAYRNHATGTQLKSAAGSIAPGSASWPTSSYWSAYSFEVKETV